MRRTPDELREEQVLLRTLGDLLPQDLDEAALLDVREALLLVGQPLVQGIENAVIEGPQVQRLQLELLPGLQVQHIAHEVLVGTGGERRQPRRGGPQIMAE